MESQQEKAKNIFYLAPLRGVTDQNFRNIYEQYFGKFDYLLTPFITTVKGTAVSPSHLRDINPEKNDPDRVIPQIIGNNADEFLVLSEAIKDLGYKSVNWNLGCPFPPVTKKRRGSGLLPFPDFVESFLEKVMSKITIPLSVKVRLGLNDTGELAGLIPVLNSFPIQEITIHPRTGAQMYSGSVNLELFAQYASMITHSVVYNGDILTAEDFLQKAVQFPTVNRWMIGRGVVKNPFLLQQLRNGNCEIDFTVIKKFHDQLYSQNSAILFGPVQILGKMKELWVYLAESFPNYQKYLKKILRSSSTKDYEQHVNNIFEHVL
ncbi:MAG: tRNA-dihydrouridine synthase family protein [Fibrobacter sp.]|nr:tRNA-dihydrouridine synthase family protein [Fibrobacter sp.]